MVIEQSDIISAQRDDNASFGNRRVAGWRQKEKPLLYNVFHIGDQIIRVGHCGVASSSDVNRLIKSEMSGQVC